jgi:hypothetical protein
MNKKIALFGFASAALFAAACSDSTATSPRSKLGLTLASAFSSTPAGFSELSSSFSTLGDQGAFAPSFDHHGPGGGMEGGPDHGGPGFGLGFMGGGLEGAFMGDGMDRGHFHADSKNCAFAAATGVTCTDTTHDGLIVKRVSKYTTGAGVVQQAIDSTTNTVATSVTVTGTATRRDNATSVVNESSSQTVTGLAKGSAQRTVNGATKGSENTTGQTRDGVAFTSSRAAGDTTVGVVIPAASTTNEHPYPTAGKVTRVMNATVTLTGQTPTTTSRREVITYDGSATANVVITLNGTTQNCTLPLPHGHLTCS